MTANKNTFTVGERVELARYTIASGNRILYGQRVNGVVRITDVPAVRGGRAYLVERELECDGYAALQGDRHRLRRPSSPSASHPDGLLDQRTLVTLHSKRIGLAQKLKRRTLRAVSELRKPARLSVCAVRTASSSGSGD